MVWLLYLRRHARTDFDRTWTGHCVLRERIQGDTALGESYSGGLVAQRGANEGKIPNQDMVIGLFIQQTFQLAPRLSPALLRGRVIAADFLSPA